MILGLDKLDPGDHTGPNWIDASTLAAKSVARGHPATSLAIMICYKRLAQALPI